MRGRLFARLTGAAAAVHRPTDVLMVKRVPPVPRSFAEVSNEVWRDVTEDAKRKVRNSNLRYLRSKADIQVAAP